jgi:hypothetical protein
MGSLTGSEERSSRPADRHCVACSALSGYLFPVPSCAAGGACLLGWLRAGNPKAYATVRRQFDRLQERLAADDGRLT